MANSDKNIRITGNRNAPTGTNPKIVFTGAAAGSSVITLEVLDDNTVQFSSNEGTVFSLDSNLTQGIIWSVNDQSGNSLISASAGATVTILENSGLVGIGATSPVNKLYVKGGVGFASTNDNSIAFVFENYFAAGSNRFSIRKGNQLRFYNSTEAGYVDFKANASTSGLVTYTLPINAPTTGATGTSVLSSDTSGNMSWVVASSSGGVSSLTAGTGISFSTGNTITSTGTIRTLRPLVLTFASGYTPPVSGADSVVLRVPDSSRDGTTATTYILREFHIRAETPSAGSSRIQLEKSTGDGVFTAVNMLAGSGLTLIGAGIYTTQTQNFAGSHVTSNDFLRLNWTLLSSTHANFSAYLEMEEV